MCDCWKDDYVGPIPCPMCVMMEQIKDGQTGTFVLDYTNCWESEGKDQEEQDDTK